MNFIERENLKKFGESIDVKVSDVEIDGEIGVAYRDTVTKDPIKAHYDLLRMSIELCQR